MQHIQDVIIASAREYTLCWVPAYVGVEGNEAADAHSYSLPRSDYKNNVKRLIRDAWQVEWNQMRHNKLRETMPTIPAKYIDTNPRPWSTKL